MAEIDETLSGFIARWQGVTGRERANYQLFLTELTPVLDLPGPEPAAADPERCRYDDAMESQSDRRRAEVERVPSVDHRMDP